MKTAKTRVQRMRVPRMVETKGVAGARKIGVEATLGMTDMFGGLRAAELSEIAGICRTRALGRGEVLFREGERSEGMFVIQGGQVCLQRTGRAGRRHVIHVFGAGDSIAKSAFGANETHPASAVALRPTQVILLPKGPLVDLIRRTPQLALNMLGSLSMRLEMWLQDFASLKDQPAEGRLAAWLLRHARGRAANVAGVASRVSATNAANAANAAVVTLHLTKKLLAGQLGVTSETLSRMLARLKKSGVIDVTKREIQILDQARLEACARASGLGARAEQAS